jgi:hypothetical protein
MKTADAGDGGHPSSVTEPLRRVDSACFGAKVFTNLDLGHRIPDYGSTTGEARKCPEQQTPSDTPSAQKSAEYQSYERNHKKQRHASPNYA